MNPIVKNVLAVLAGLVIGGLVNAGIIMISGSIIPLPEGVDPNDIESIKANMGIYETKHFIMPLIAHAMGTLAGAFTAAKIAANRHVLWGILIGGCFMIGGIMMINMLPEAPMWTKIVDLGLAYLPMGYLGARLGMPRS